VKEIVFDIETDGFLEELTKTHCLVLRDANTDEVISCADQPGYVPIEKGLEVLHEADSIIGHNILDFDIPALQKVYPTFKTKAKMYDSLIISRLIWASLALDDTIMRKSLPKDLVGRHKLEAWGHRLGNSKGDFKGPWDTWTPEMQEYCVQDVNVNTELWKLIKKQDYSEQAIELEQKFALYTYEQMRQGMPFNTDAAKALYEQLLEERIPIEQRIQAHIPPRVEEIPFTPKSNNSRYGYQKGVPTTKKKRIIFNPGSRKQIAEFLQEKYKWEPVDFTEKGNIKVDHEVLENLPYPEAQLFDQYLTVKKLCGQIAEGDKAWLKLTREGRIYGSVNHNGARTGRCTHSGPNLAQIPRLGSFKGEECRSLFITPPGADLIGCDAKGLELRNLAHYLYKYDGGKYAEEILQGDIHTKNQQAAGLPDRDTAKRFIYAHNYGAGDAKLGSIINPTVSADRQKQLGKEARRAFAAKIEGMGALLEDVRAIHKLRGWFRGLDGRRLKSVSAHSALNTILQGAGAIVMKHASVLFWDWVQYENIQEFVKLALHVHDEYQVINYKPEIVSSDWIGQQMARAIEQAGAHFDFNIPLEGDYKIGKHWAETH
jgi:DNA polymerase I-like protein with 3'-5' exonuclease and polymerase domains